MSGPQSQISQVGDEREVTRALGDPQGVPGRSPRVGNQWWDSPAELVVTVVCEEPENKATTHLRCLGP